jgi:hypothetical protein
VPPAGIEIDRERGVREIFGAALRLYVAYPWLFITLALGVIAPYALAVLAITGYGPLSSHEDAGTSWILLILDTTLVAPLVSALHIHAVRDIGEGRQPRLADVARRSLRALPVVVAAVAASSIGIAIGFVLLIAPGVLLTIAWAVVAQAAALDREGWIPALRRSRELTRDNYVHVFGLLLFSGLIVAGVTAAARAIHLDSSTGIASLAVGIGERTITASFTALTVALLYYDLLARSQAGARRPAAATRVEHQDVRDLD